jgi:hypothetical protein
MRNDKPGDSLIAHMPSRSPGRPHTFVVTLLATLLVGLTVTAIRSASVWESPAVRAAKSNREPTATSNREPTATTATTGTAAKQTVNNKAVTSPLSRNQLKRLGGISLGLAILSLLLPRRSLADNLQPTPELVAHSTGLPVVGSLFPGSNSKTNSGGRVQRVWVNTAEGVICIAFGMTLVAYFLNPELFATLRKNPLTGYLQAIHQLTDTVTTWLAPRLPLA